MAMTLDALYELKDTPAYVADLRRIDEDLALAARIKRESGIKMMLAMKAFSQFSTFDTFAQTLDGTTASGLYEALLGHRHFAPGQGKEIHTYSPAYDEREFEALLPITTHLYFNSVSQLERFAPRARLAQPEIKIGLRVNPEKSLVKNSALYDPSAPGSRFGVKRDELTPEVMAKIDILHFHNLCENPAADSEALLEHLTENFAPYLAQVDEVNLGGGHYFTKEGYDLDRLITALNSFRKTFAHLDVTLEPGGALVYDAGYLVTRILDVSGRHVIIDSSASAHMPDVLEVPYRPSLIGSGEAGEKTHTYLIGGRTCMTGDIVGEYSFDNPLNAGDVLIFTDMAQYAMVKNTTFNGVPLPAIGILDRDGSYRSVKIFGYEDFEQRLS